MAVFNGSHISFSFSQLGSAFGEHVTPTALENGRLFTYNAEVAKQLGLNESELTSEAFRAILSAEQPLAGRTPFAMKYTGHQFGQYNPALGDGRGVLLGEWRDADGTLWDWHLKGAGKTPYSRHGDGRAVLRSTLREYLASAAMTGLNIPTTQALAMAISDTPVMRERIETAATLLRVTESHVRFGHFEYLFYSQQHEALGTLADYVIARHFPELAEAEKPYAALLQEIVERTADMIAQWQAIGFNHGVMNTDNMSILGQTFDYGPYAFLDDFDPGYICNHSDYSGRYAFNQQPAIALWNLSALGYAFTPLVDKDVINDILGGFEHRLQVAYSRAMRDKLGLSDAQPSDSDLFNQLFALLEGNQTDYTCFFYQLSQYRGDALLTAGTLNQFKSICQDTQALTEWLSAYQQRVHTLDDSTRLACMQRTNPKYILRNYLAQAAIEAAEKGDLQPTHDLMTVLAHPFDEHPSLAHLANPPTDDNKGLALSCSS
ncbi:protein adenylyltransferase SelO [Salinivibrio proteolyticus]|uniref:Protein nucleotidyltransferase YdiU n=1 Tax=Salinivibrio proteolyticus TaxID=334715 RepID=A0ABY7LD70_9GAMM|nr:YdiU family protein [Salinivibrio proteolyticus]WBA13553.1 YdiU family protein [Salinivibrio proteolyticus]